MLERKNTNFRDNRFYFRRKSAIIMSCENGILYNGIYYKYIALFAMFLINHLSWLRLTLTTFLPRDVLINDNFSRSKTYFNHDERNNDIKIIKLLQIFLFHNMYFS